MALQTEVSALEKELFGDPRYQKMVEAKRLLALYTGREPDIVATPRIVIAKKPDAPVKRAAPRSPVNQAILDTAAQFLAGRSAPTSTADVFDYVAERHDVPGKNPKNNLSAMLSNSSRFQSHGRTGWTLALETPEAPEEQLALAPSEASNTIPASPAGEPDVRSVNPWPGGGT
ncbi:hypothetical protein [Sphingopyxis terrae]|uniref:hypothetical protein n=1 Tax=Sphingopyxis terrae TaxID=33052 RepID=UPI001931F79E|nr:hypothetical protein [Sphingopyxis terrae]